MKMSTRKRAAKDFREIGVDEKKHGCMRAAAKSLLYFAPRRYKPSPTRKSAHAPNKKFLAL